MKYFIAITLTLVANLASAAVTSFDDIQFWAGEGTNRAALAIDWFGDDATDTALVWGYRWNGSATGEQMLRDVLAADDRLFAKLSAGSTFGIATYGLGYDENDDSLFELDDNTSFNGNGIAITSPSDGAEAIDSADRYREGWSFGYWHYGLSSSGPGGWISSGSGPTDRALSDGDWDSYAFATTLNNDEFAENLIAALPGSHPGDFNGDGTVDAADYTVWRDGLGTIYIQDDYNTWLTNFGSTTSSSASSSQAQTIPEPATAVLLFFFLVMHLSNAWPAFGRRITNFPSLEKES